MEVLSWTYGFVIGTLVPFLFVLTLVVFVHEMGHYLVARLCGIRVLVFSVGFGPELVGWNDRHGTRWKVSAVPLGGYVRFFGDENVASAMDQDAVEAMTAEEKAQSFPGANVWRRAATVAAGPIANFLLAIVIFAVMFGIYGKPEIDPVVSSVVEGSAAAEAGIKPGDVIVAINGSSVDSFDEVRDYVTPRPGVSFVMTVNRDGRDMDFTLVPRLTEIDDPFGNKVEIGLIGIQANVEDANFKQLKLTPIEAVAEGAKQSYQVISMAVLGIRGIVTGRQKADQLRGPIGIAQMTSQVATLGFVPLLNLVALLSVSIGFLNLLPIPILDGGHLMFYLVEVVRGKPVSEKAQDIAFRIGLSLLLALLLFVTWNDVTRS
jgi:regulator of sigma E protease